MRYLFDPALRTRIAYLRVHPTTMQEMIANMQRNGGRMVEWNSPEYHEAIRTQEETIDIRVRSSIPQGVVEACDEWGRVLQVLSLAPDLAPLLPEGVPCS